MAMFGSLAIDPVDEGSPSMGRDQWMSAQTPTLRERIAQFLMGNEVASLPRENFVKGLMGTTGVGSPGIGIADLVPGLGSAMGGQEAWRDTGDPKAVAMAMLPGKAPLARAVGDAERAGIRAFHGSPHDFDKFDLSRIGTGEGAQAYGHGLYFAENEAVARDYRSKLSDVNSPSTKFAWGGQEYDRGTPEWKILATIKNAGMPEVRRIMKQYEKDAAAGEPYMRDYGPDFLDRARAIVSAAPSKREITPIAGRMYEVNINAKPDQFLDWDRQVTARAPEPIRNALNTIANSNPGPLKDKLWTAAKEEQPGWYFHSLLSDQAKTGDLVRNQRYATDMLREAGIPGIKYLDQGSRVAGGANVPQLEARLASLRDDLARIERDGGGMPDKLRSQISSIESQLGLNNNRTSNYVLFDDKLVDILRKYGIAGVPAAGAGGAMFGSMMPDGEL